MEPPRTLTKAQLEKAVRQGEQLKGADLSGAHLEGANLTGAQLQGTHLIEAHLEGANLTGAQLQGAHLGGAHLERTTLSSAHLEQATLVQAHLDRASLPFAHLEGADLMEAHLEGADLTKVHLEEAFLSGAHLEEAYLGGAWLERADLSNVTLGNEHHIGPSLVDVRWGTVNLAVVDWSQVTKLGDELEAGKKTWPDGRKKERDTRLFDYRSAVRANRQLAVALQAQGLSEEAARFAYRAQRLQRIVVRRQKQIGQYLFSGLLDLLAGYGYKPGRSVIAYLLLIGGFALTYYSFGHLAWYEALVVSLTAFHGRGFFAQQFQPGDPQSIIAALEAVVGLLIEISFIATFTQRFFGK